METKFSQLNNREAASPTVNFDHPQFILQVVTDTDTHRVSSDQVGSSSTPGLRRFDRVWNAVVKQTLDALDRRDRCGTSPDQQ